MANFRFLADNANIRFSLEEIEAFKAENGVPIVTSDNKVFLVEKRSLFQNHTIRNLMEAGWDDLETPIPFQIPSKWMPTAMAFSDISKVK